jgi:hypothetical protein
MADVIEKDIDNVRYSFETQEFFNDNWKNQ